MSIEVDAELQEQVNSWRRENPDFDIVSCQYTPKPDKGLIGLGGYAADLTVFYESPNPTPP